jgi:hypothetical protein
MSTPKPRDLSQNTAALEPPFPNDKAGELQELAAELMRKSARLGGSLHPVTRRSVAALASADRQRRNDLAGGGNLSDQGLSEFCRFFLNTAMDQVEFMTGLLDLDSMQERIFFSAGSRPGQTRSSEISPELLALISEVAGFKGAWRAFGTIAPERLKSLRHIATVESIGSSTRLEGSKRDGAGSIAALPVSQSLDNTNRVGASGGTVGKSGRGVGREASG